MSFVYVHAGTPFQKKGDIQMALPKMDVPIGVVEWEVFVPEQYSARAIDGNVIDAQALSIAAWRAAATFRSTTTGRHGRAGAARCRRRVCCPDRFAAACSITRERQLPGATVRIAIGRYRPSTVSDAQRRVHVLRRAARRRHR